MKALRQAQCRQQDEIKRREALPRTDIAQIAGAIKKGKMACRCQGSGGRGSSSSKKSSSAPRPFDAGGICMHGQRHALE